jgi:uncharacterized protein YkwD
MFSISARVVTGVCSLAAVIGIFAAPLFTSAASAHTVTHTKSGAQVFAKSMLHLLNEERAAHHLPALTMNQKLITSAHRHNVAMAKADEMSHQCKGEKFFADRITAAGYDWMSAGENIGWNSDQTRSGLRYLEREMYHEKAPDNGHRLNILDHSFRDVGIDVYFDKTNNKMWFTQDFGQPA